MKTYGRDKMVGDETEVRVVVRRGVSFIINRKGSKWLALNKSFSDLRDAVAYCRFNGSR